MGIINDWSMDFILEHLEKANIGFNRGQRATKPVDFYVGNH